MFNFENLPLIKKKKAPVSLATALAIRVLPVPGGPYMRIPRGGYKRIERFCNKCHSTKGQEINFKLVLLTRCLTL